MYKELVTSNSNNDSNMQKKKILKLHNLIDVNTYERLMLDKNKNGNSCLD